MSSKLVKGGLAGAQEIAWCTRATSAPAQPQDFAPSSPTTPAPKQVIEENGEIEEVRKQLHACQQHSEVRVTEAHKKGLQVGLQQGLQQGDANARQQLGAQQDASLQRLARTIEEISGMRQRCRAAAEQDVVKLALAIARRVVHRELTVDPSAILGLVKAALGSLDMRELHRIRIHPGQADAVRLQLEKMGLPQRCEVVADPSLEKGAAILETNYGTVDASAETQLQEIERGFADLVIHAK
jgi:flagellar assembly protein FliH